MQKESDEIVKEVLGKVLTNIKTLQRRPPPRRKLRIFSFSYGTPHISKVPPPGIGHEQWHRAEAMGMGNGIGHMQLHRA